MWVLQQGMTTEAKRGGRSPSTAPVHKSIQGTIKVETGTGRRTPFEKLRETPLEPLKHSSIGELSEKQMCLLREVCVEFVMKRPSIAISENHPTKSRRKAK